MIIAVILVFTMGILFYESRFKYEYRIFAQIAELNVLEEYITGHREDPNIGKLEYNQGLSYSILYKGNEYLVCAYEFADPSSSVQYYENIWNEEFNYWTEWWSRSQSGPTGCEYMTFDGDRALYFSTQAQYHQAVEFENWLAQALTIELPDHNTPVVPNEKQMKELQNMIEYP